MSGLNYLKLGSTLSNICNTTQLDKATKCHHAFKNFWGEPWFSFVICAFYRLFSIGSLRMSEKRGTLEGFGFKKSRPIDDGRL